MGVLSLLRFMGVCWCGIGAALRRRRSVGVCQLDSGWARVGLLVLMSCHAGELVAETTYFRSQAADGVVVFSDAPLENGTLVRRSYGGATRPVQPVNPCRGLTPQQLDVRAKSLTQHFDKAAAQFSVDVALIMAVARAESCFDPAAISRAGARGLMQLMPATAQSLGVSNIHDLQQNLQGGAQYLADMLERYADTHLALAAYNAGPGNVDKYQGVPPFPETRRYIKSVLRHRVHYEALLNRTPRLAANR